MINIDNNGSLCVNNESFGLFSDSLRKHFFVYFSPYKNCSISFSARCFQPSSVSYLCVELCFNFLRDFYFLLIVGNLELEFSNIAHHEDDPQNIIIKTFIF